MPLTSSGLRNGRGCNSDGGGGREEEEGSSPFKPGFPSEEADNKGGCRGLGVEKGEVERRGG